MSSTPRSDVPPGEVAPPETGADAGAERDAAPDPPMAGGQPAAPAGDAFVAHLYRGTELLREGRLFESKEELERALALQPLDPRVQDLLGDVASRIGLYPRAIQIYEGLAAQYPRDAWVKTSLAVCYLRTGLLDPARSALEEALRLDPDNKRALGYLGLVLQNLGELDDGIRSMAEAAFSELDAGDRGFVLAQPEAASVAEGLWRTLELGDAGRSKSPFATTIPPLAFAAPRPSADARSRQTKPSLAAQPIGASPARQASFARRPAALPALGAAADLALHLHETGALVVRLAAGQSFAGRLESIRVLAGATSSRVLHRRVRDGDTSEVVGGIGSPVVRIEGPAQIVLGARPSREVALVALEEEGATLREDALLGFELALRYESDRLAPDPAAGRASADGVAMLRLQGRGAVALEIAGKLATVAPVGGGPVLVRRDWLLGWTGDMVARPWPPSEAPNGQRGLIGLSGEGLALVCVG
ncbi:MAG: tetratricopeptide repeat protein [Myxococcales bacterium]|nr:tetratricopeptide repeat protein [Myxococcales bacterium]